MVKSPVGTFRIFCLEEHLEISFRADPFSVIAAPLELIKSTFLSQHDSKNKSINNYPYLYQNFFKKQTLLWTWLSSYKRKNIILSHIIFLQILWQTAKRSSYSSLVESSTCKEKYLQALHAVLSWYICLWYYTLYHSATW